MRLRSIRPADVICHTFSENEIAVALVPFVPRLEVELTFHLVLRFAEFVSATVQSISNRRTISLDSLTDTQ